VKTTKLDTEIREKCKVGSTWRGYSA